MDLIQQYQSFESTAFAECSQKLTQPITINNNEGLQNQNESPTELSFFVCRDSPDSNLSHEDDRLSTSLSNLSISNPQKAAGKEKSPTKNSCDYQIDEFNDSNKQDFSNISNDKNDKIGSSGSHDQDNFNMSDGSNGSDGTFNLNASNISGLDPPRQVQLEDNDQITESDNPVPRTSSPNLTRSEETEKEETGEEGTEEEMEEEGTEEEYLNHRKNVRKSRQKDRNSGKSYLTAKGIEVPARACSILPDCKKMCRTNITREEQMKNFQSYWEKGEYLKRKNYMKQLIDVRPKQRSRGSNKKFRQCSAYYSLYGDSGKIKVCRRCFQLTLGETKSFISDVVTKLWEDEQSLDVEWRGKNQPPNKTSEEKLGGVNSQIARFPAYESHYSRSHTSKKYLPPNLSIPIMYNMYKDTTDEPVSINIYRQQFNKTGLKFKSPQLDTCGKCDAFHTLLKFEKDETKRREIEEQQFLHHEAADNAYKEKCKDKKEAKLSNGSSVVCSFDLQQCLPTPVLKTSEVFYKRQLWTYNFTINNNTANQTKCYMWHEGLAKRGGNEISSCLFNFIETLEPEVKHLKLYSDCCAGQNKNKIVLAMMSVAVANHPSLESLDHKFLISGHTHMECDSDHAVIERAKKVAPEIHLPEDWYKLVRIARPNNPFEVIEVDQSTIYDFENLYKNVLVARKKDEAGNQFSIQKVRWLRYTKEQGIVYYEYTFWDTEKFMKLDLRRKKKFAFQNDDLELCYSELVKIAKEKKNDLISLLHYLRPEARMFYENLPAENRSSTTGNYDPDIADMEDSELNQECADIILEASTKKMKLNPTSSTKSLMKKKSNRRKQTSVSESSEDSESPDGQNHFKKARLDKENLTARRSTRLLNKRSAVYTEE